MCTRESALQTQLLHTMKIQNFSETFNFFQIYSHCVEQYRMVFSLENPLGMYFVALSVQVCEVARDKL
jgi:hypothetical protein